MSAPPGGAGSSAVTPGPRAALVRGAIDPAAILREVGDPSDGAVLLFLGVVRDHAEGRPVRGMAYEAYEAMAAEVLGAIAHEASERLGTPRVVVVHRLGELEVGEVSVAIAVGSPHRDPAYEASRFVIEEIKRRLPVWKHERFADGVARWVEGRPVEAAGGGGVRPGRAP